MAGETVFRISVELGSLIPPGAPLNRDTFPHLAHAVETVTAAAHARWSQFARGYPLPNGKVIQNRTGEYLRSIQARSLGDFSAEVFSVLPYAAAIEAGSPARDMKRMLDSSLKVRLAKDGTRYLIIPFRHNNPTSVLGHQMPVEVWNWWHREGRNPSHVTGTYRRLSGTGAFDIATRERITVPGWRYGHTAEDGKVRKGFGTRLGVGDLVDLGFHKNDKVTKRLAGMVNFRQPNASGGAAHSSYITFRVMSEKSTGWIAPAREGLYPARTTADEIRPVAEELFEQAAAADIKALLGGS